MLASISGQSKPGPSTTHSQSSDIIPTVPLPPSSTKHSSPKLASSSGQSKVSSSSQLTNTVRQIAIKKIK